MPFLPPNTFLPPNQQRELLSAFNLLHVLALKLQDSNLIELSVSLIDCFLYAFSLLMLLVW